MVLRRLFSHTPTRNFRYEQTSTILRRPRRPLSGLGSLVRYKSDYLHIHTLELTLLWCRLDGPWRGPCDAIT